MLKIGDKEYRNLQEQVEKNKNDILFILQEEGVLNEFGIKVIGQEESLDDLPSVADYKEAHEDWAYGDAYAIGTEAPFELYVLTRANGTHPNDYWFNIGEFPMPGPQGEVGKTGATGEKGDKGDPGIQGIQGIQGNPGLGIYSSSSSLSTTINDYTSVTLSTINSVGRTIQVGDLIVGGNEYLGKVTSISTSSCVVQTMYSIKGDKGDIGNTGATGSAGPKGDSGLSIFYCSSNISTTIGSTVLTPKEDIITQSASIVPTYNDLVVGANGYLGYVIGIGTNTYQIKTLMKLKGENGTNGTNGTNGQDGVSPSVSVSSITGGHEVSITDAQGTQTFDVMDGIDGTDGVTPSITAQASVDSQVGTPTVTVTKSGTNESPTFTFEFHNLKGETGTSLISVQVVQTLPASGTSGTLYFVPNGSASGTDLYSEYIWINNAWELLGTASVDLTNYIQKSQTSGLVKNDGTIDTNTYALASSIPSVPITGIEVNGVAQTPVSGVVDITVPTAPTNYVTTDTAQNITGSKTLQNTNILVPGNDNNFVIKTNNAGTINERKAIKVEDAGLGYAYLRLGDSAYTSVIVDGSLSAKMNLGVTGAVSIMPTSVAPTPAIGNVNNIELGSRQIQLSKRTDTNTYTNYIVDYPTEAGKLALTNEIGAYITTAPSAANTDGTLKIVVLSSEPATYYAGYIYYITES